MTWNELYLWCNGWCHQICQSDVPDLRDFATYREEMAEAFARLGVQHEGSIQAAVIAIIDGQPLPELEPGARLMLYEMLSWARLTARLLAIGSAAGIVSESPAESARVQEWLLFDAWSQGGSDAIRERIAGLLCSLPPTRALFQNN